MFPNSNQDPSRFSVNYTPYRGIDPAASSSSSAHLPSPGLAPVARLPTASRSLKPTSSWSDNLEQLGQYQRQLLTPAPSHPDVMSLNADMLIMINELQTMTVDKLKQTIKRVNDTLHASLRSSGLKGDLLERLKSEVVFHSRDQDVSKRKFHALKSIIADVYNGVAQTPSQSFYAANTNGQDAQALLSRNYPSPAPQQYSQAHAATMAAQASYQYGTPYYNPQASGSVGKVPGAPAYRAALPPPRFHPGGAAQPQSPVLSAPVGGTAQLPMRFRTSPFYAVEKAMSTITTLGKAVQGDRKTVQIQFALMPEQAALLTAAKASPLNPQYQVRLYSTSEDFFTPARPVNSQNPAPVEFPASCEIKLNNYPVVANTKGIKKMIGSTPPVDLGKVASGSPGLVLSGAINRVDIVYANTEKRYFMAAFLVKVTSIKQAVDKVRKSRIRTKEEVVASIIKMNSDPDVEATAYGLQLKDPLSFMRIKTPIRASTCTHIACFDADCWFMMMEQTPSWACPICSKTLKVDDLAVDGYFESILRLAPSSAEEVIVEPDGTWKTPDNRHGTAASVIASASAANSVAPSPAPESNGDANGKGKARAAHQDSLTLDSDDSDDGGEDAPLAARRNLLNQAVNGGSATAGTASPVAGGGGGGGAGEKRKFETIDLTGDSSEDEQPVRLPPARRPDAYPAGQRVSSASGVNGNGNGNLNEGPGQDGSNGYRYPY